MKKPAHSPALYAAFLLTFALAIATSSAQIVNQAGGTIIVEAGATLVVEGDLQNAASLRNFGTLVLENDFVNSGTFQSGQSQSTIIFQGTSASAFDIGAPSAVRHLENRKAGADVTLVGEFTVTGSVDLTAATNSRLLLGNSDLRLGPGVPVNGAAPSAYFVTDGTGSLVRELDAAGALGFPVGTTSGYSEVRSDVTGTAFANASVAVRAVDGAAPALPAGSTDYVARHWAIVASGVTDYGNAVSADYLAADVVGDETNIVGASYADGAWSYADAGRTARTLLGTVAASSVVFSGIESNAPVPVELVGFAARRTNAGAVLLTWRTASERGTEDFAVERSLDAAAWTTIGTRDAAGDSDRPRDYDFLDEAFADAPIPGGRVYYRLRINDLDGSRDYSDVRVVNEADAAATVSFYPNPTTDVLQASTREEILGWRVFDQTGREVRATQAPTVGLGGLPNGIYRVELTTRDARHNAAVVVHQ